MSSLQFVLLLPAIMDKLVYIRGELAPAVLLIDTAQVAEFEAHLAWAGLKIEPQLAVGR